MLEPLSCLAQSFSGCCPTHRLWRVLSSLMCRGPAPPAGLVALPGLQAARLVWDCLWSVLTVGFFGDPSPFSRNLCAPQAGMTRLPERSWDHHGHGNVGQHSLKRKKKEEKALYMSAAAFSPERHNLLTSVMTLQFRMSFESILCSP